MIFVPRDADSEQILDIVRAWIDLLAAEDYQAAFDAIAFCTPGERWRPEFIKSAIKDYRSPQLYPREEEFWVTDWRTAQGGNPEAQQKVIRLEPNSVGLVGAVAFDLPLNGQWSSLRVDFAILENDGERGNLLYLEDLGLWDVSWPET